MYLTLRPGLAALVALGLAALASPATATDYQFFNFDAPVPVGAGYAGTTINGLSNAGALVGFAADLANTNHNFVRNTDGTYTPITLTGTAAQAAGLNSGGTVVGFDGADAFTDSGGTETTLSGATTPAAAFGINDTGTVVGQETVGGAALGFVDVGGSVTSLDPAGSPTVNAQGVNGNNLVAGFYVGADGQDHGLTYDYTSKVTTLLPDPVVSNFLFSQVLGVNDMGEAAGYYGTTDGFQHGFLLNLGTDAYTFLDDPSVVPGGSAQMQITGINNTGEIAGFYSDANGITHGFYATPAVPESSSLALLGLGLLGAGVPLLRARRRA